MWIKCCQKKKFRIVAAFIGFIFGSHVITAYADLMINPTRIVFEGRVRNGQLELLNNSDKPMTYRVKLVNRRMNEIGEFIAIDDKHPPLPDEKFADKLVRFSPPQITLSPGKSQIIRLALSKPEDLPDGEYRSHLLFEQIPETGEQTSIEAVDKKVQGALSIKLTALFGATIPIIVRQGKLDINMELSDARFSAARDEHPPVLDVAIHRQGQRSAYGDILVQFVPQDKTEAITVGRVNGIAVYAPNALRNIKVTLHPPPALSLAHGKFIVQFLSSIAEGSKPLAETNLPLP